MVENRRISFNYSSIFYTYMSHHSKKKLFLWTFLFLLSQLSTAVNLNFEDNEHSRAKSRSQRSFQTSSLLSVHNVSEDASIGTVVASLAYFKEKPGDLYETNYTFRIAHDSDIHRQFSIEPKFGKVSVAKPLDRENKEIYRLRIEVTDRDGSVKYQNILVNVVDVNDNAPYLNDSHLIIWENEPPGFIGIVTAYDPDGPGNGPPFFMNQTQDSPYLDLIYTKFDNKCCVYENGFLNISSLKTVDREGNSGKVLEVPILTRDSGKPPQEAVRFLRIEIGDKNDNPMSNGFSTIHVYNYKGQMPSSVIGRVYVDDLDDWDVIDKDFKLKKSNEYFTVTNDGIITMSKDIPIGTYTLEVAVYDRIRKESATGIVKVVVDYLDEEALDNLGSIRIRGISAEDFLRPLPKGDTSPYERFRAQLASRLNLDENDVKLFSIMPMPGNTYPPYVEIFFAVRRPGPTSLQYGLANSAYVSPTLLTGILERYKSSFESALQMPKSSIVLVNIDPCVYEQCTDGGCTRVVTAITDHPMVIIANKTSLVGVNLNISSICRCPRSKIGRQCSRDSCFNGGVCHNSANGFFCQCRESILNGSRCESRTRSFMENGFAWLKPIGSCDNVTVSLEFMTKSSNGILIYNGPMRERRPFDYAVPDLLALEIRDGHLRVKVNLGTVSTWISLNGSGIVNDGEWHVVDILANRLRYEVTLDHCSNVKSDHFVPFGQPGRVSTLEYQALTSSCKIIATAAGSNEQLNVDEPLQLGGVAPVDGDPYVGSLTRESFVGCIRNLRINGELFDLGDQGVLHAENSNVGCSLTPPVCQWVEPGSQETPHPYCVRGECVVSMSGNKICVCETGWHGPRCDKESAWKFFGPSSFVQYAFYDSNVLSPLHSNIRVLFIPQQPESGDLVKLRGSTFQQNVRIGLNNKHIDYSYTFGLDSTTFGLTSPVNLPLSFNTSYLLDVERYGLYSRLTVDGLTIEPFSTYRIGAPDEPFYMNFDKQGLILGAGSVPPSSQNDFVGCIKELYVNDLFLSPGDSSDDVRVLTKENVYNACTIFPICQTSNVQCPPPLICVDFWKGPFCACPAHTSSLLADDGTVYGCGSMAQYLHVGVTRGAIAAILICFVSLLVLVLMLVVYSRRHRKLPSSDDHLIGNVCDYKEEGGGEADQGRYDIVALRKPVFPSDYSMNGSANKTMQHLNGSMPMSRMNGKSDADLDAFLQDRLGDMNGDLDGLYDEIRRYSIETDNISVVSLSSLSSNDSSISELDDDRLDDWGPKFKFIADAFRYDKNRKLD